MHKEQLLLAWALSEALSPRWAAFYDERLNAFLKVELKAGDWNNLSPKACEELVALLYERRKPYIEKYIDPATRIRLIKLPVDILERVCVSPTIGWRDYPVTLGEFLNGQYSPDTESDPRNYARKLLHSTQSIGFESYPIFAYDPKLNAEILIEGYARCISLLYRKRAGEPVDDVYAWRCAQE